MALRTAYQPLRPDLDKFLFAAVGDEADGVPLSMISAFARLGLDPWDEAGRLAAKSRGEAAEQLARLIGKLPDTSRPPGEAREIAGRLVELLPKRARDRPLPVRPRQRGLTLSWPTRAQLWIVLLVLGAAVLVGLVLRSGFPFNIGSW